MTTRTALAGLLALCAALLYPRPAAAGDVRLHRDERGFKLQVEGRDFMVLGMNWGYMPIGENYTYSLWTQPEPVIEEVLRREMTLLREMGVNTIRQYVGIPRRWITYIFERYGIYTVLNHPMGRYGFNVDGVWVAQTDYADPATRRAIRRDIEKLVDDYKGTPGLLMWLLGNENNYGLAWTSGQVEDLPAGTTHQGPAEHLYSLFGEIAGAIKARDPSLPIAIANGDVQYIDLIAKYGRDIDIFGSNVYRGASARDLFDVVAAVLGKPVMFTEFGADAYDARRQREDHLAQAGYLRAQWQEIYEHSYGKGRAGNAIGGMTFQWADGWWKYLQDTRLDIHDTNASWSNAAYPHDYMAGDNNMNEEWFGICAKGPSDELGLYELRPRAAYYVLQAGYQLDPYAPTTTLQRIRQHWGSLDIEELGKPYELASATARLEELSRVRVANLRLELEAFFTDGRRLDEPARNDRRLDHLESFYVDFEARPTAALTAELSLNVLGNVPSNPIDEIFYERRGQPVTIAETEDGTPETLEDVERVKVYGASVEWRHPWFELRGFYRRGHYHWGYEGDFFGLYREAYYGEAIDLYDAGVPLGVEVSGKRQLEGLDVAFGPELYWGANPMVIGKYQRAVPGTGVEVAVIHQEELAQREAEAAVSTVIPAPRSRRTSIYVHRQLGPLKLELGGLMAGTPLIDEPFVRVEEAPPGATSYLDSGYFVADDQVRLIDTLGAKAKLSLSLGRLNWYAQGAYKGIVADGGPDSTLTFTGWRLKESGRGNHLSLLSGATFLVGDLQIAPNAIYQRPLVGPLPNIPDYFDPDTGDYFPGVRPRNILDDPFVVRGNQEMLGGELLLAFDPTPATFLWAFDNDRREDALLAGSLDVVWRHYRQSQDAGIGVFADGGLFAFESAPPPDDLWEVNLHLISNPVRGLRLRTDLTGGRGQSRGSDERLVDWFSAALRGTFQRWAAAGHLKLNAWGPYDYHHDFNLTFPLQLMGDLSYGAVLPNWHYAPYSRVGIRGKLRTLDENSARYSDELARGRRAREWEITTYLHVTL